MTFGSLFSGIGGLDLGLEWAGMEVRWQVEIDAYCRRVLERHWPDVKRWRDVRELTGDELEAVDLICGGFPCQPVSQAGRRKGQEDPRWLWPEFARIVRRLRPRYVLVENVPGLLSCGMGQILGDLAALGYDAEWDCIPAAAFGAPHLRYRVFIVGYTNGEYRTGRSPTEQPFKTRFEAGSCRANGADSDGQRRDGRPCIFPPSWPGGRLPAQRDNPWAAEPRVGRVAHGVPARVDRLRALGNAIVPQVADWLGRLILEAERRERYECIPAPAK